MRHRFSINTSLIKAESVMCPWHSTQIHQQVHLGKLNTALRNKLRRAAERGYGVTKTGWERAIFFFLSRVYQTPSSFLSNSTTSCFLTVATGKRLTQQKTEVIAALAMFSPSDSSTDHYSRHYRSRFSVEPLVNPPKEDGSYVARYSLMQYRQACPPSLMNEGHSVFYIYGPSLPVERLHMVAQCMGAADTRQMYADRFDAMAEAIDRGLTVSVEYADNSVSNDEE